MISARAFPVSHRRTAWAICLCLGTLSVLSASVTPVIAHGFHGADQAVYQQANEDFVTGILATFYDVPVLLGLIAAGLLSGIWKPDGFSSLWPYFLGGNVAGAAVGFSGVIPPSEPAYVAVIAVGLLGAAALSVPNGLMRGLFFALGLVFTNAVFSGYEIWDIPLFAYMGVAFALNLGVAIPAGLVWLSRTKLPYGWVTIAWRANMSWVVAIALMAMVLSMKSNAV